MSLAEDAELAARIAEEAGRILLAVRAARLLSGPDLGRAGDATANVFILSALAHHRPDDAFLSEESADAPERLASERVWIVDPLDGTREYAEGRTDWAVHVGLAVGGIPAVGAVALPAQGRLLRSDRPPPPAVRPDRLRMLVSRTRPPALATAIAARLGAELVPMGSAGAKAMCVLLGEGDIYLHAGGQYEWDNCAPAAVALGAGFEATRLDGSPLRYNRPDPLLPDLLICPPAISGRVREALAGLDIE